MKKIIPIIVLGILVLSGLQAYAENITIENDINSNECPETEYDLVIIAPRIFSWDLQRLITHKNDTGIKTILKTTEEIYKDGDGVDQPEQIKYFIKHALEEWNISYVLLVGGLKSRIWAIPREHPNYGAKHWYLPVRYTNMYDNPKYPLLNMEGGSSQDPGVISDLYYADIYKENESTGLLEFEDWDPNNDGIFAAMDYPDENFTDDLGIDLVPDVAVGRLACRSKKEVRTVVTKIINYELNTFNQAWFNKTMVFSGDGFLDQQPLDIMWDTNGLPDGEYTIVAQSYDVDNIAGPTDTVKNRPPC